jgi:DNA polymerase delta subunit 1
MHPFLLQGKKRYAAVKFEGSMDNGKVSYSGLEVVRRDNCPLLKQVQTDFFKHLLEEIDPEAAAASLLNHIKQLMSGKVSLENLTISKNLSKLKYAGNQIHVSLNNRIRERTPALAYKVGERVPYVVVTGQGQLYDRGEDPTFVQENCIPIDRDYYFKKQIMGPMMRLLVPLFGITNARLFFERARSGGIHDHFKSDREDWILPVLGDKTQANATHEKSKKRKVEQKNTLDNFLFRPS